MTALRLVGLGGALALSGCALLYEFEDGGGGAPTGGSSRDAATNQAATNASATAAANASTDASASSMVVPPPTPGEIFHVGSSGPDDAVSLAAVSETIAVAVEVGASIDLGQGELYAGGVATVATVRLDANLAFLWADADAKVDQFDVLGGTTHVAALPGGNTVTFGTMEGRLMPFDMGDVLEDVGAWASRRDGGGDPFGTFHTTGGEDVWVGGGYPIEDGSFVLGINGSGTIGGIGAPYTFTDPSGSVRATLDLVFGPGDTYITDTAPGDAAIDFAPAGNGVTVSLVNLSTGPGGEPMQAAAIHYPTLSTGAGIRLLVDGRVRLAPSTSTTQFYCETLPEEPNTVPTELRFGRLDFANRAVPSWGARFVTPASCDAIVPFEEDYLLVGTYRGGGFANLPPAVGLDGFLLRLTAEGDVVWAIPVGGEGDQALTDVTVIGNAIYASGKSDGTLAFGSVSHVSKGSTDGFVVQWIVAGT